MMRAASLSHRLASASLRARLRGTASVWTLAAAAAAFAGAADPARAACTPTTTPTTGQTVTCDISQPNPVTTAIVAQPGSNNVTVNMLSGAQLNVGGGDALIGKFDGEFASHSSTYAGTGTVRYAW
jgi:hypothetical protein